MTKPRKPRVFAGPADRYASPGERIMEFSYPDGTTKTPGGLISFRWNAEPTDGGPGRLEVVVYRQSKVKVTVAESDEDPAEDGSAPATPDAWIYNDPPGQRLTMTTAEPGMHVRVDLRSGASHLGTLASWSHDTIALDRAFAQPGAWDTAAVHAVWRLNELGPRDICRHCDHAPQCRRGITGTTARPNRIPGEDDPS